MLCTGLLPAAPAELELEVEPLKGSLSASQASSLSFAFVPFEELASVERVTMTGDSMSFFVVGIPGGGVGLFAISLWPFPFPCSATGCGMPSSSLFPLSLSMLLYLSNDSDWSALVANDSEGEGDGATGLDKVGGAGAGAGTDRLRFCPRKRLILLGAAMLLCYA